MSQDVSYYRDSLERMRKTLLEELDFAQSFLDEGVQNKDFLARLSASTATLHDVIEMVDDILEKDSESERNALRSTPEGQKNLAGKAAVSPMSVFEKGIKSLGDMLNCSKKMAKKI
jgi:hypothetical protein